MRVGLESFEDIEKLKNLKENDLLYSAMIESVETEEKGVYTPQVHILTYQFKEYVKAPGNQKGIWAKLEQIEIDENGNRVPIVVEVDSDSKKKMTTTVQDLTVGLFLSKAIALEEFYRFFEQMFILTKEAYDKEVLEQKKL